MARRAAATPTSSFGATSRPAACSPTRPVRVPDPGRPLPVLARHLVFGLTRPVTVESDTRMVGGRPAAHRVLRGVVDGREVEVESLVVKGDRCVHDFLYVAPPEQFEAGRRDFQALVESFSPGAGQ